MQAAGPTPHLQAARRFPSLSAVELVGVIAFGVVIVVALAILAWRLKGGDHDLSDLGGSAPAPDRPARRRARSAVPPPPPPGAPPAGTPPAWLGESVDLGALQGSAGGFDLNAIGGLLDRLHHAMEDGQLDDGEIAELFPGATVVRDGGTVRVDHASGWGAADWGQGPDHHHVEWRQVEIPLGSTTRITVDGREVGDLDQIPDPAVREQVRRIVGDLGRDAG
jgi:hypothetical protein